MQYARMLVLVSVAAIAIATIGAPSAMAEEANFCKVHENECALENVASNVHLVNVGSWTLLSKAINVLCLGALANLEALGTSTTFDTTALALTQCGTNSSHNDCTVTAEELPTLSLTETALDLGELTVENGEIHVKCGFFVNCTYSYAGLSFAAEGALHSKESGNGMLTVNKGSVERTEGMLCPEGATIDALLEPLEHLYVVQPTPRNAVLCKLSTDNVCPADEAYTEYFKASAPDPVFESGVGFMLCETSYIRGWAGNLSEPLLIELDEIEFNECKHHAGGACKVLVKSAHALVLRSALNLGTFQIDGMIVTISCSNPSVVCVYEGSPSLHFKGSTGTGLAPLTASSLSLAKTVGGSECPATVAWSGAYKVEVPDPIYLGR